MSRTVEVRLNLSDEEKNAIDRVAYSDYKSVNHYLRSLVARDLQDRGASIETVQLFQRIYVKRDDL